MTTTFAWVGAELCEVIFSNDLLLLLEGQTVHLPAPKLHYSKDIKFKHNAPIFCTGKDEIVFVRGGTMDSMETHVIRCRWHIYCFHVQIVPSEQQEIQPCP